MRYAIVFEGVTVNVIVWDGEHPLTLPEGHKLVPEADAPPRDESNITEAPRD